MSYNDQHFQIDFDFITHLLIIETTEPSERKAIQYAKTNAILRDHLETLLFLLWHL
jgi:hypothetical protein